MWPYEIPDERQWSRNLILLGIFLIAESLIMPALVGPNWILNPFWVFAFGVACLFIAVILGWIARQDERDDE